MGDETTESNIAREGEHGNAPRFVQRGVANSREARALCCTMFVTIGFDRIGDEDPEPSKTFDLTTAGTTT
jgi:hypothetical protein